MKNNHKIIEAIHIDMAKQLEEIKRERIKAGKEKVNCPVGMWRYTLSITKHNLWQQIKRDIINADLT